MDKTDYNIFFLVLTLILSKCQRQFKILLAVGRYRFLSFKRCYYFRYFGLFYCDICLFHKYYEKPLLQILFIGINFL